MKSRRRIGAAGLALAIALLGIWPTTAPGRGHTAGTTGVHVAGGYGPHHKRGHDVPPRPKKPRTKKHASEHPATSYCSGCVRDASGRIARSEKAKDDFMAQTGHPHGWPGHVVDHIVALKRGGADEPWNMQWQTVREAKAKDRLE
jgi:hypothetical protein